MGRARGERGASAPCPVGEDRGLTPPARQFIVSSEVDMHNKVTPAPGSMPSSRIGTITKTLMNILKGNEGFRERSSH